MPLTKLRRPKFERQDIKQSFFTSFLSCQRLHKIQGLLKIKKIDAILVIIGIDGRFNAGSLELFNYLFFDIFSTRKDDIERSKLDDDIFDDFMLCIKQDEIHIYCNGANYWLMLPYFAHWPGIRLHCISEIEMVDPEKFEKFKMETFAEITKGCDGIAVATKGSHEYNNDEQFDPMFIENWPIVQSYAYDDFGLFSQDNVKKGFFTLAHRVIDISTDIHKICREIDPVHLENLYQKVLPQMEGLIENIFQLLDSKCFNDSFEINEEMIEEPVISYFQHLKNNYFLNMYSMDMYPFVLSGQNTRQSILTKILTDYTTMNSTRINNVVDPMHLIFQCVSLYSGIVIARTIFLKGCSGLISSCPETDKIYSNVMKLSIAYNAIISTVDFLLQNIKTSKYITLDELEGQNRLKHLLQSTRYSDCKFSIKIIGSPDDSHGFMVIMQGIVFDIFNEEYKENLGSVIFADTFVITKAPLNKEDNINGILRLGRKIPLCNYLTNNNLSKLNRIMKDVHKLDPICTEMVDIILTNRHFQETDILQTCCTFYTDRIVLFNKRVGATIIYPDSIDIFEGDSYGDWTILSITCSPNKSKNCNWIWNQNNEKDVLHLVFTNHCKLRKSLTNVIIPKWKELISINKYDHITCPFLDIHWKFIQHFMTNNQISFSDNSTQSIIDGISEDIHQSQIMKIHNTINFSLVHRKSCVRVFGDFMVLSYSLRFYDNCNYLEDLCTFHLGLFEAYERNWRPYHIINHDKLSQLNKPALNVNSDSSIVVTVLCGLPGSGQELLARKITKIIHDDCTWILLSPKSIKEITSLTENMLKSFDGLSDNDNNNYRILLFAPSFCFPNEIIKKLQDVICTIPIIIGNVCVCLNPEASYMDNKQCTLPGVLDMCNEGWVNTILLTGTDMNSENTNTLHRILKVRNNLSTIFLTPKADVTKEFDTILSKVSFWQDRFDLARILYPLNSPQSNYGLKNFKKIFNGFYELSYNLYGPLIKDNIIKTFRDIYKAINPENREKNIYFIEGIITLEEEPKQLFSLTAVSLTKQLIISPMRLKENRGDCSKISSKFIRIYLTSEEIINTNDEKQFDNFKKYYLSILTKFQRQLPVKIQKLCQHDLKQAQIDEIHKKRHLDPLPEGWFYNGITYVHMDGSRSDKHPGLGEFIDNYITEENEEIDRNNSKIDSIIITDAFIKP